MEQAPQDRIEQLEKLVATLRHDLRGVITPAALIADRLRNSSDPSIQRSAARITDVVERILSRLNATYESSRRTANPGLSSERLVSPGKPARKS